MADSPDEASDRPSWRAPSQWDTRRKRRGMRLSRRDVRASSAVERVHGATPGTGPIIVPAFRTKRDPRFRARYAKRPKGPLPRLGRIILGTAFLLRPGQHVGAREPAVQVDILAALGAERIELAARRLAAFGARTSRPQRRDLFGLATRHAPALA